MYRLCIHISSPANTLGSDHHVITDFTKERSIFIILCNVYYDTLYQLNILYFSFLIVLSEFLVLFPLP